MRALSLSLDESRGGQAVSRAATEVGFAGRNLWRHRRRSLIAVLAVSTGALAALLVGGFTDWLILDYREATIHSHYAHIQVAARGYFARGSADPFSYLLSQKRAEQLGLERMDHVTNVSARLRLTGLASNADATIAFIGEALDPSTEPVANRGLRIVEGEPLSPDVPSGLLLGQGLARNLKAAVGTRIALVATTKAGGINAVEGTVRGIFSTVVKAYDDSAIRLPVKLAQRLLRTDGVHILAVYLDDTENTDEVMYAIQRKYGKGDLEFAAWYRLADFYRKTVELLAQQIGVVKLIIMTIIVLGIINTQMMSISERTGEIGTRRAIGDASRHILRAFLLEGTLLGTTGAIIGMCTACVLARLVSEVGIPMPPAPGMAEGYEAQILISHFRLAETFVLAVLATLAGSLYPAWKASRIPIVDALRHNR
jgi:putative ABC transport system permease protein